jgi:hypothetical protein
MMFGIIPECRSASPESLGVIETAAVLGEFLAFRHLFRGASIMLMRWEKLVPLLGKVDPT